VSKKLAAKEFLSPPSWREDYARWIGRSKAAAAQRTMMRLVNKRMFASGQLDASKPRIGLDAALNSRRV
jgi:hypothetical protein